MRALTIQQPWAWAIGRAAVTYAGKTIENRTWPTTYRGPLAIHAGQAWDRRAETFGPIEAAWGEYIRTVPHRRTASAALHRTGGEFTTGAIIAVAELVGVHCETACVRTGRLAHQHPLGPYACSPWAVGDNGGMYHWELSTVRLLPEPVPCKGRLGLWVHAAGEDPHQPSQVMAQVLAAVQASEGAA